MSLKEHIAAARTRHPRLTRAAGWALLGGVAILIGQPLLELLDPAGRVGGPLLGLLYSGVLAGVLWRGGHASGRRAALFALLALFWFHAGWIAGFQVHSLGRALPHDMRWFAAFFGGFLAASLWLNQAGLLVLPVLRAWRAAAWLLGIGTAFATLVAALKVFDLLYALNSFDPLIAAWAAVQAAAFALALPPPQTKEGAA